jgi:3-oxoacid CoA-transferase subunit B/acetate CoA/acetoacetate CoA-transferase beta subunit
VDATVLGALQVSQEGDLANWMVPGKIVPGMGGAMDLVVGARRVIIATTHTTKKGEAKIVRKCTLPLTAKGVVKLIVTEYAVFSIEKGQLKLLEIAPETTLDEIRAITEADFTVADPLITMQGTEEEKA